METALWLIALAVTVLAGTAISEKLRVPAPLLLSGLGIAGSFMPFIPEVHLSHEVVLIGLLPPLLYAAAIQTSLVDFNANRRSILMLSVGLVIATTLVVGLVVKGLIPGLPWPAAFAIGAVVAPPDAVAATAIGRRIGLPRRIVTILEGESLLNDATALVALRTAIAALGTAVTFAGMGLDFLYTAGVGVLIGVALYVVVAWVRRLLTNPLLDTALSFVIPFAAYLAAEEIHASGVLAVVITGLLLGHRAPVLQTAQSRIIERMNWRMIAFVLENAVFLLIGLQAKWIFGDAADNPLGAGRIAAVCLATLATVILARLLWVFPARFLLIRKRTDTSWGATFLLGWAGMRGVVTLAAAFIIPTTVPHREVLLLAAFTVVAGTLFIQGLSLPWFARRLRVAGPDPVEDALARATLLQQASVAGAAALDRLDLDEDDAFGVTPLIQARVDQRNFAAWERLATVDDAEAPSQLYARARGVMIEAERARILEIRKGGTVASEVIAEVLAMLDIEESMLDSAEAETSRVASARRPAVSGQTCAELAHLAEAGASGTSAGEEDSPQSEADDGDGAVCPDCIAEGTRWVALRRCLTCGNVACCDSSPGQHANAHWEHTRHPVIQSAEPGEDWRWCYVHHQLG